MTTALSTEPLGLNRATVFAALASLVFIVLGYKLLGFSTAIIDRSWIEPMQQAVVLGALPVFQILKALFLRISTRGTAFIQASQQNPLSTAFIFALSIVGLSNLVSFFAGAAAGAAAAGLSAGGAQGNANAIVSIVFAALEFWVIFPTMTAVALILGWSYQKKQFRRPWLFFLLCYLFLLVAVLVESALVLTSKIQLGDTNTRTMVQNRLIATPIMFTIIMMIGFGSRSVYSLLFGPKPASHVPAS